MNIEIKDSSTKLVDKICKETKMNPSRLIEYLLDVIHFLYSDYERQKNEGVEQRSFSEILTNLFLHSFKSNLRTLDVAENLIESTNELLEIENYIGASIYSINPDFNERSISYMVSYDFCIDAAHVNGYKNLGIDVEINQDYMEVSHIVYLPTLESMEITDKEMNNTSNLIQQYIRAKHRKKFSPFANIAVEPLPNRREPLWSQLENTSIYRNKTNFKADKAAHIPSIEKISLIAKEVYAIVFKELLAR